MGDPDLPPAFPATPGRLVWGLAGAIASTGVALGLALLLRPLLYPMISPLFLLAVAVSAVMGGLLPGLLAAVLSVLAINLWFVPPIGTFSLDPIELVRQLVFFVSAAVIALLGAQARLSRLDAEARSSEAVVLLDEAEDQRLQAERRTAEAAAELTKAEDSARQSLEALARERDRGLSTLARLRYQGAVAALAKRALETASLQPVLNDAAATLAQILELDLVEVLELLPSGDALLLRAGSGWPEKLVGHATVSAAPGSLGRLVLDADATVLVPNLKARTETADLLKEQGAISGMSVAIPGGRSSFGTLGGYTKAIREFTADEIACLHAVADLLAAELRRGELERVYREGVTGAFAVIDREWRYTFANAMATRIAGKPAHELIGTTIWDAMPALLGGAYEERLRTAMEQRVPVRAEFFAPGQGWLESRVYPHQDGLAIHSGDAERRRSALEAAGAGEWEWDPAQDRLILSDAAARLHGLAADRSLTLAQLLRTVHQADRTGLEAAITRSAANGAECAVEYRVPRAAGVVRRLAIRGRVLNRGDSSRRLAGIVVDLPGTVDRRDRVALVVETETAPRQAACEVLEERGYRWLSAGDATEALELLERYGVGIRLLVTETSLPDMTGPDLAELLAERYGEVPVLYTPSPFDAESMARKLSALAV
jgi:PAS domain-containing protein